MSSAEKMDFQIQEYLKKKRKISYSDYIDNAVWSAFQEAVKDKKSPLRRQIEEVAKQQLITEALSWQLAQANGTQEFKKDSR